MKDSADSLSSIVYNDICVQRTCPMADYNTEWTPTFNDRMLVNVTACFGSSLLFAAREGWINTHAPICTGSSCEGRNRTSYCSKRTGRKGFYWRFRCCKKWQSLLKGSMFAEGKLQPGNLLEILWKMASRTLSSMIPRLVYGRPTSEVYARIKFLRDVVG